MTSANGAALTACLVAACAPAAKVERVELSPPPRAHPSVAPHVAWSTPEPLFPEDPALDAVAVANAAFVQETWTGAGAWQQHCHGWGFSPAREEAVRDAVNERLAARGVHLPDKPRARGVVVALGKFSPGVVAGEPLVKLVVCTEGIAPKPRHDAFAAPLLADPRAPRGPAFASLGTPDVAWERIHSSGEVEFGFRYPYMDPATAARAVAAVAAAHDPRYRAKLRADSLWWTGLRRR